LLDHFRGGLATLNDFQDPHLALNATVAALVAAGALPADAPVIDDARAVLAVLRPDGARPVARPRDLAGGDIGFWPALDRRATSIDLIPTATTARAVIRVPVP
jgi:hypothetical protein